MPSEDDVAAMLINPVYAISIDPDLAGAHETIVSRERWITANKRLIDELGVDQWLNRLLAVLEGKYPMNPDDPTVPDGYRRTRDS
jgi:hypothetical protein